MQTVVSAEASVKRGGFVLVARLDVLYSRPKWRVHRRGLKRVEEWVSTQYEHVFLSCEK